jgi:putative redox protein
MKLNLKLVEVPFVLQVTNEEGASINLDAAPSIGGKGAGMRPMEVLASALAGCMSIDVLSILRKQRQEVSYFQLEVNAIRKESVPAAFEKFELLFTVNKEVALEKLENAVHLSHEKYCSVSASLNPDIAFTLKVQHQ